MPSLSLSSPLGLVMWSAVRASWRLCCSAKFDPQLGPPNWKQFLRLLIDTLAPWLEHPTPTLPHSETKMLLHCLRQLNGLDGLMDHPRAQQPPPPPDTTLHYWKHKKSRKQGHEEAMREYFEHVINRESWKRQKRQKRKLECDLPEWLALYIQVWGVLSLGHGVHTGSHIWVTCAAGLLAVACPFWPHSFGSEYSRGVATSMSGSPGVGGRGRQGVPSPGPPCRMGVWGWAGGGGVYLHIRRFLVTHINHRGFLFLLHCGSH